MLGDAEAYERFMGRWSHLVAPRLVDFTDLPERGRMVDVGSGTGSLAFAIAERKIQARVLGIDTSQEYVAYASSRNRFADRASFEVGDVQQLRFGDASFDAALSLLVFNFNPFGRVDLFRTRRPGNIGSATVEGCGSRRSRHVYSELSGRDELDDPAPNAHQLRNIVQRGGIAQQHIRRSGNPRRRRVRDTGHGSQSAHRSRGGGCNCWVRQRSAHAERQDIHHRDMIHDVGVGHLVGVGPIDWQHNQGTGRHAKTALHRGTHTHLHWHLNLHLSYCGFQVSLSRFGKVT